MQAKTGKQRLKPGRIALLLLALTALCVHLLLAIWFFAGRYYAGDLSAYSARLEAQLGAATALEWKLGALRLEWRGLNPVISLGRLEATFPHHNAAQNVRTPVNALLQKNNIDQLLLVKDAEVYLDVAASLWHRQPMLHGLRANEIHFTLEKTAGNQLLLAGLQRGGASDFDVQQFINHFQYADVKWLLMRLVDSGNGAAVLHQPAALQFSLDNQLRLRRLLAGTLPPAVESTQGGTFDASTNGFALQAISDGRFLSRESSLRAHFFAHGARSSAWFNLFSGAWSVADLDMQLWLSKNKFGRLHGHGRVENAALRQRKSSSREQVAAVSKKTAWPTSIERMSGDVTLHLAAVDDFRVAWHDLSLTTQAREVLLPDGVFIASHDWLDRRHLSVTLPQWNLRPLLRDALALQILPPSVDEILRSIDPDGMLQDIEVSLPENNQRGLGIHASVQGLATKPWKGAPGVTGLSGQLLIGAREGRFELHSEQQLSLLFPKVYRQPHTFGRASGSVRWSMQADRLLIDGSNMALQSVDGTVDYGAAFSVNARTKANTPASSLRLRIGFTNGQLEKLGAFVPYTVPQGLRDWIAQSNASGRVSEGGFIFNGSLKKGDAANRNIKLYFDLDGASANYAAEWPPAQAMHGRVLIAPARSIVDLDSLSVSGLPLTKARIDVHTGTTRKFVQVDTALAGSVSSGLQLLQTMPLASKINRVIGSWQGGGELQQGSLRLRVPLSGQQLTVEQLDFAAHLHNADLQMRNFDLNLNKLNGPIAYDLNRGLQSPGLRGQLWGKPWRLKIGDASSSQSDTAAGNIFLQASGAAEISSIQRWLRQPALGFASGVGNFSLQLVQSPQRSALSVNSDLQGVALEAPLPFYKLATRPLPLTLDWDFGQARQPMSLALPGMLHAQFEFDQFKFNGGELTLLDDTGTGEPTKKAAGTDLQAGHKFRQGELIVNGSLATFNLAAWQNALQRYQRFASTAQDPLPAPDATASAAPAIRGVQLRLAQGQAYGREFANAVVSFEPLKDAWAFDIESDILQGRVTVPTDMQAALPSPAAPAAPAATSAGRKVENIAGLPQMPELNRVGPRITLDLAYLRLPAPQKSFGSQGSDAAQAIMLEPNDLRPMQIDIQQLYIGQQNYGSWRCKLTGGDNVALAHDIQARHAGLTIRSEADDGLLWAYNQQGQLTTALNIHVGSQQLQDFLASIDQEQSKIPVRAKRFEADVALAWPGPPERIALTTLSGSIDFAVNDGKFYKVSESATGFLKLLGLFNFDSLLRRMQLDFSDIYKEGLSFDQMKGELVFDRQRVEFVDVPIEVSSPSSKFVLGGAVDFLQSTIDAELVATMPVANNLPWIAALAGGLPVAAGTFIVTRVLGEQFDQLSSAVYTVDGKLDDPQVKFQRLFDNKNSKVEKAKR